MKAGGGEGTVEGTVVEFVGAGPGAPDLLTLRAARLINRAQVLLYAGSLVPCQIVAIASRAEKHDTSSMVREEILALLCAHARAGLRVVRLHSGDPSLYGAIAEQIHALQAEGIACRITPGVPAFAAAAAALTLELTLPEVSQTVILTRTQVRASAMPEKEELARLGASGATLAIHLSINNLAFVCRTLSPLYGEDCPVVVAYRVSWSDEMFLHGTLADIRATVKRAKITRTALVFVGRVLASSVQQAAAHRASKLYDARHSHCLRSARPSSSAGSIA